MNATDDRAHAGREGGGAARGRTATAPTDIPARGWKDIAWRVFKEISADRVMLTAAGVTFYLLLALGPLLAALVSLYGLFLDPADIATQAEALAGVLPGGAVDILTGQLERLTSADQGTLGFAFVVSLALALWSANAGMKAMFEAMNIAYDEREDRGFVRLTLTTLALTVSLIAGVIALGAFNAVFTAFEQSFGVSMPDWIANLVTAGIALVGLVLFMACLYRFGPSRESPQWQWITPGAILAGVVIVLVSVAFSFYVSNFGSYNETYGSLGALVGFLTWLWLAVTVLVMGAELNSEMEHQTRHDTTTGPREPMGERGATVADELGREYGKTREA